MGRLFDPASVAASAPAPRGLLADRTIQARRTTIGRLYLVNSLRDDRRAPCFPLRRALPEAPDCCIVVAAKDAVEEIATDCAKAGVGGIMLLRLRFSETGRDADIEAQLRSRIGRDAACIVGPNCIGMLNFKSRPASPSYPAADGSAAAARHRPDQPVRRSASLAHR